MKRFLPQFLFSLLFLSACGAENSLLAQNTPFNVTEVA